MAKLSSGLISRLILKIITFSFMIAISAPVVALDSRAQSAPDENSQQATEKATEDLLAEIEIYNEIVNSVNDVSLYALKSMGKASLSLGFAHLSSQAVLKANNAIIDYSKAGKKIRAKAAIAVWLASVGAMFASAGTAVVYGIDYNITTADFVRLTAILLKQRVVLNAKLDVLKAIDPGMQDVNLELFHVSEEAVAFVNNLSESE